MAGIKLEAGKKYKTRNGKIVEIMSTNDSDYSFAGSNRAMYTRSGHYWASKKESQDDLIQEVKEEKMKFKPGDKVRAIKSSGSGYTKGKIYEVSTVYKDRISTCLDNLGSTKNGWNSEFFELVEDVDSLIKKANEGYDAIRTLYTDYHGQFKHIDWYGDEIAEKWKSTNGDLNKIRLEKIELPKFESFAVGKGWEVKLQDNVLKVGCSEFNPSALASCLKGICMNGQNSATYKTELSLNAKRTGVAYGQQSVSWEEADKILSALKKAGY